jgi:hypothetical protein
MCWELASGLLPRLLAPNSCGLGGDVKTCTCIHCLFFCCFCCRLVTEEAVAFSTMADCSGIGVLGFVVVARMGLLARAMLNVHVGRGEVGSCLLLASLTSAWRCLQGGKQWLRLASCCCLVGSSSNKV